MSEQEVTEPYIYQPFGSATHSHMGERLYGIGGLNTLGFSYNTKVEGFTSEEASRILAVIKSWRNQSNSEAGVKSKKEK